MTSPALPFCFFLLPTLFLHFSSLLQFLFLLPQLFFEPVLLQFSFSPLLIFSFLHLPSFSPRLLCAYEPGHVFLLQMLFLHFSSLLQFSFLLPQLFFEPVLLQLSFSPLLIFIFFICLPFLLDCFALLSQVSLDLFRLFLAVFSFFFRSPLFLSLSFLFFFSLLFFLCS